MKYLGKIEYGKQCDGGMCFDVVKYSDKNGNIHREGGPAIKWYLNGQLHSTDFYINGIHQWEKSLLL